MDIKLKHTVLTFNPNELRDELNKNRLIHNSFMSPIHDIFHINRIEDYIKLVGFPLISDLQPRRITVFNFFFLKKGRSSRSKGLDSYHFAENTFFFLPPYQITTHQFISEDAEGFYCHFNLDLLFPQSKMEDFMNDFPFLDSNNNPLVVIDDKSQTDLLLILERLLKEYIKAKDCNLDILKTYLNTLFTEIKPFANKTTELPIDAASLLTKRFKKSLTENSHRNFKIFDYAENLSVTPNHLNKTIKKTMGKSAHALLDEFTLMEAKVLLRQTKLPITEIAHKIGKSKVSDFVRFFKKNSGMTPGMYRKKIDQVQ